MFWFLSTTYILHFVIPRFELSSFIYQLILIQINMNANIMKIQPCRKIKSVVIKTFSALYISFENITIMLTLWRQFLKNKMKYNLKGRNLLLKLKKWPWVTFEVKLHIVKNPSYAFIQNCDKIRFQTKKIFTTYLKLYIIGHKFIICFLAYK